MEILLIVLGILVILCIVNIFMFLDELYHTYLFFDLAETKGERILIILEFLGILLFGIFELLYVEIRDKIRGSKISNLFR